ncbi:RseA family anti-sigma factor [Glaciecola sp. 1036]|uniref:RseA family anti-sigma factor n=1 Tax=Alteromonadaceae TaxID=72275 RepID=UPI003D06AE3F
MSQKFENLSAVMDGEVEESSVIKTISQDSEMSQKWKSYHLSRDLLRGDASEDFGFDISARVAEALESELPIVAPKPSWKESPLMASVIPLFKQSSQFLAAACVTAVVIFGFQSYNQPEEAQPFIAAPSPFGPIGGLTPVSLSETSSNVQNQEAKRRELQIKQMTALLNDHDLQLRLKQSSTEDEETVEEQEQPNPEQ